MAKSNYEVAAKVGDRQGSKWSGYERGKTPNDTTVANVNLVCAGSAHVFHEGPEESKLFTCMFSPLEDLGLFDKQESTDLFDEYLSLNPGLDRGCSISLRDLTKKDFDQLIKSLSAEGICDSEPLKVFGVQILLFRMFLVRSKFVNSRSRASEITLRMVLKSLANERLTEKLKHYKIHALVCEWLFNQTKAWIDLYACNISSTTLDEALEDPYALVTELNLAVYARELTEEVSDPSGKYSLSANELAIIF